MKLRSDTYVTLAIVGVGGYLLYKFASKAGEAGDKVATTIADLWVGAENLFNRQANVVGNAVLPNGALIPLKNMDVRSSTASGVYTVYAKYGSTVYKLSPHDANGNYPATPV